MRVELIDNAAGAQEACANCGERQDWMNEIQPEAFPKERMILCPDCVQRLEHIVFWLVRTGKHRPTLEQVEAAYKVPDHIRQRGDANEAEDRRRSGGGS